MDSSTLTTGETMTLNTITVLSQESIIPNKPSTSQHQKKQKPRKTKRKVTKVPQPSGPTNNVADEDVYEEMDDSLERAATTATSLDAEQDRGNINNTQSKATLYESSSLGTSLGSGLRYQETMGDTIAQTGFENVSKTSNDSLLTGVNTPRSDEDSLKLKELMELFKRLEKKGGSRTHKLKRLYKVGRSTRVISSNEASLGNQGDGSKQGRKYDDIDKDAEITLVYETQGRYGDDQMFDIEKEVSTADPVTTVGEVVTTASIEISTTSPTETIIADDLTLAQTLIEIRKKGKGIMEEHEKPTKKTNQIRHDEEVAQRLQAQMQAKLEEEDRIVRQREEEATIFS
ncbi:hypothetical protein Tco_0053759 [Tanacetum coccineum]